MKIKNNWLFQVNMPPFFVFWKEVNGNFLMHLPNSKALYQILI